MAAKNNLTLTAWAIDNASGPIGQISKAAGRMPDNLSKASSAMSALGGASQELGGPIASTVGRLSGLASLVATSGPLGLGIAALTVAASAGAVVWNTYQMSAKAVESMGKSLDGVLKAQASRTLEATKRADELEKALRNYGKTASEVARSDLERSLAMSAGGAEKLATEIGNLEEANRKLTDVQDIMGAQGQGIMITKAEQLRAVEDEVAANNKMIEAFRRASVELKSKRTEEERALQAVSELMKKEDESERATKRVTAAKKAKAEAERDGAKAIAEAQRAEEQYAQAIGGSLSRRFGEQARYYDRVADMQERDAKQTDRQMEDAARSQMSNARDIAQAVSGIGNAWAQAATSMINGTMTAAEASKMAVIQSAETAILAAAASAAAKQIEAHSFLPFVGIAIGTAAAAVVFALIKAQMSKVPKAATGGLVTGGVPGRDSVLINTMPGELILPVDVTRKVLDVARRTPSGGSSGFTGFAGGGRVTSGAAMPPGKVTIVNRVESIYPASSMEKKRIQRVMANTTARMIKAGQIPSFGGA